MIATRMILFQGGNSGGHRSFSGVASGVNALAVGRSGASRVRPSPYRGHSSTPPSDAASAPGSLDEGGGDRPIAPNDGDGDAVGGRSMGPTGDLFHAEIGPDLVGRSASVRRTFGPRSNAEALLACGGPGLARHASFDRDYGRAREWIRRHPVGPAVVGPVLVDGLVGALVEAALPQSVPVRSGSRQMGPLIVGVEVEARVVVESVRPTGPVPAGRRRAARRGDGDDGDETSGGYEVTLRTEATRARDGSRIAEGTHSIWIPDYMRM